MKNLTINLRDFIKLIGLCTKYNDSEKIGAMADQQVEFLLKMNDITVEEYMDETVSLIRDNLFESLKK